MVESITGKDVCAGSGRGVMENYPGNCLEGLRKINKTPVRIADAPAEI
jgi:hypothetical protein